MSDREHGVGGRTDAVAGWGRRVAVRDWPALLVAAACLGLSTSVWVRPGVTSLLSIAGLVVVAALLTTGPRRLALAGLLLALAGLWWGSLRSDALDRSFLATRLGESESARVVVTGPGRRTPFALRVPAEVVRFGTTRFRERVLLELPPERAPPQGAVLELRAQPVAPRGPETGFDERGWLARRGVHVVLRGEGGAHRRPAGWDRWRRRPAARAHGVDDCPRDDGRTPRAPGRDRARRGRGPRRVASQRLRGERPDAPAGGLGTEHGDHGDRGRRGCARRGHRAARRRGCRDPRRARVRPRGGLAAVRRQGCGRRRAGIARLDRRPSARPVARALARGARPARVDAVVGARARLPALVRRGRGDLRRPAATSPACRTPIRCPGGSGT